MNKVSQDLLLQRAEGEFLKGDYVNALRSYGLILKDYPLLDEARIGVYLSDLGAESEEEAQALFDYYQMIKTEKENAVDIIDGLIDSSTKVVITDKDEFIDFVTKLANEGFDEMALGYLDATTNLFGDDQDVLALYNVVRGSKK